MDTLDKLFNIYKLLFECLRISKIILDTKKIDMQNLFLKKKKYIKIHRKDP